MRIQFAGPRLQPSTLMPRNLPFHLLLQVVQLSSNLRQRVGAVRQIPAATLSAGSGAQVHSFQVTERLEADNGAAPGVSPPYWQVRAFPPELPHKSIGACWKANE